MFTQSLAVGWNQAFFPSRENPELPHTLTHTHTHTEQFYGAQFAAFKLPLPPLVSLPCVSPLTHVNTEGISLSVLFKGMQAGVKPGRRERPLS